jgi:lipoprotein NlpI/transglutaminase-like putative cysteine protease
MNGIVREEKPMSLGLTLLARAVVIGAFLIPAKGYSQPTLGNGPLKEVQIAADAFSLADPLPSWVDSIAIPEASEPQPVVIRLADTQILVRSTPVVYVRRAVMVNDAASLSSAGQLAIPFVPQYQRLQLHAIRVLRGRESLDRTASAPIRFLQRETGLERGVYSGEVTASILVDDLRVGDTLEFSYSVHGQNPVFGDRFVDTVSWDQVFPTLLRRVVLNHPVDRKIGWRVLGDGQSTSLVPTESRDEGTRTLLFEEKSMAKIAPEALTPPDYAPYRTLQFSEFLRWQDVVGWANGLFQANDNLDEGLKEVVERLRKGATEEDRIVGALEFVQSEIRYFSVSLGESSHRPTQPNIVGQRRYGDCKDKSLLLMTLLKELGVQSRPVLLKIGKHKGLDRALPSPQLFDHVILQVTFGGKTFYLDPTRLGQHGRLSRMGQIHEGAQVLVVAPETTQLSAITTANLWDLVHSEVLETASLSKLGAEGQLRVRQTWNGAVAEGLRVLHERVPRDQIIKSIGNAMEPRYPGATLVGEPEIQDDRTNNVLSMTTVYSVPNLAIERGGNWYVRFFPSNLKGAFIASPSSVRTTPLHLRAYPFDAKYTFEMKFPDEVSVISDPRSQTLQNKHFTYTVTSAFRGNVSKDTIELRTLADRVEAADLSKYSDDLRAVGNVVTGVIVVTKSAATSKAAKSKKDFTQALRERLQETVAKTTEAIKSGKLTGSDLAASYCLRSNAYADLGMLVEALADANEAVKLVPNSPTSLQCRAEAYFEAGEFKKSVDDYSTAIALGATKSRYYHHRGISKFYAGLLDEAAGDFIKASDGDDKEAQVYSDLWLSSTYLRLGKPLPDAVAKRAAEHPRGDWPRPALGVMTGNFAPEEMLLLLDQKTGDDRIMASSEGFFYLGQYYLARGDTFKAREFFERTRRLNVILFTEHVAAGFELQRLGAVSKSARDPAHPRTTASVHPENQGSIKNTPKRPRKTPSAWTADVWNRQ